MSKYFHHLLPLPLLLLLLLLLSPLPPSTQTPSPDPRITTFQNYLRINTAHPTPDYPSAVSFLSTFASSIPTLKLQTLFFTTPNKPLLLITWPGTNPTLPSLLLNSHLDSVPAEPSKWTHPPFSAEYRNGNIYARGAQDDKCIAMQYLEAIKSLHAKGFEISRTLHVSFVPDEEIGGFDGMELFAKSEEFRELNVGFVLDEGQASVGEEYRVFYADRTVWSLVIKAVGVPGHGSRMYDNSCLENLMKSFEGISRFREGQFDIVKAGLAANSEVVSVNPVYLKAGIESNKGFVMNMQPSEAEAGFDVRLPPSADAELLKKRIKEEWAPSWRNMTYEIVEKAPHRDFMGRPLVTPPDASNPWWLALKRGVEAAGGKLAKPEILASTTDAKYMRQMGIPTLGFSPMKNTPILLHDHNEHLNDNVYLEGITVYESVIKSLTSV